MEGDAFFSFDAHSYRISIHSLRMEGDLAQLGDLLGVYNFNPLPPHGGRQECYVSLLATRTISIHSLRMEGDVE